MRMQISEQGIMDAANQFEEMAKENLTARKAALRDIGQQIKKALTRNRNSGAGMAPLGHISRMLGHKKPWGKKKFTIYMPKGNADPYVIVTTKGANKNMEEGSHVVISEKFRKFLAYKKIFLKRRLFAVPARPLFRITWDQIKGQIGQMYSERFFRQLERAVRAKRFRGYRRMARA